MLCAAHNQDLAAARRYGLRTAFIARPAEYGPHQVRDFCGGVGLGFFGGVDRGFG